MLEILSGEPDLLTDLIDEAKSNLTSELMAEVKSYTRSARDELALLHAELGIADNILEPAGKILARVFAGATVSEWEAEDEGGYVLGWKDNVALHVVENETGKYLVKVRTHLDKSYGSVALRLFEFFSNSDQGPFKKALICATVTEDVRDLMAREKISVFNFVGTQIC